MATKGLFEWDVLTDDALKEEWERLSVAEEIIAGLDTEKKLLEWEVLDDDLREHWPSTTHQNTGPFYLWKSVPDNSSLRSFEQTKPPPNPRKLLGWELLEKECEKEWYGMKVKAPEALDENKICLEHRNPPPEFRASLLPYQKEWLAWSLKQEASETKGGILADEMGMGKTIQAISLIFTDRALHGLTESPTQCSVQKSGRSNGGDQLGSSKELPQVKATLVICPVVAVNQWRCEIEKFTTPGLYKVLVFHGPKRALGVSELSNYDIVLSTYSIVQLEHWNSKSGVLPEDRSVRQAKSCIVCQVKRKATKATNNALSSTTACLGGLQLGQVCAAPDTLENKIETSVKTIVAHSTEGRARKRKTCMYAAEMDAALQEHEECAVDASCMSSSLGGNSVLHSVKWRRIILDEAHTIKNGRCRTAKAIFALKSTYKWALSGTPIQNRVGELQALVRFLGVDPYSYFFCNKCDCKLLDYEFAEGVNCECGHTQFQHFSWWNKFIAHPIKTWGFRDKGRMALYILEHKILAKILLRRTKDEQADLVLPPRAVYLRRDIFDSREEDFYRALYERSQLQFKTYVESGTVMANYAHILALLTRLRQTVLHPYLVVYSAAASASAPKLDAPVQETICGICQEPAEDLVVTDCLHPVCRICMEEFKEAGISECPICQTSLRVHTTRTNSEDSGVRDVPSFGRKRSSILKRINLEHFQSSTKIDAVREEVFRMLDKDPGAKAIVFSQFTSMLHLIGFCLQKSGLRFVKLDGSMTMKARDEMINNFNHDGEIKVFLMGLRSGGVALNLTVASHVFMMDPCWNPAVEEQAHGRVHRMGQYRPVRVIRFVIENTVEERILALQEKKQLVFQGVVGRSAEALEKLNELDLRFLFSR